MSHAISPQPSSTSPYKTNATEVPKADAAGSPKIVTGECKNREDCLEMDQNDGYLNLSCGMFARCCQFIGNTTIACCDAWANLLIEYCEVNPSAGNTSNANCIDPAFNYDVTSADHWLRGAIEGHAFGISGVETAYPYSICNGYYDGGKCDSAGFMGLYDSGGGEFNFGGGDLCGGDMGGDCGGGAGACGGD